MLMNNCTKETQFIKEESTWSVLEQVAREGARKMLQLALENEVEEFAQKYSTLRDESGRKVVAKNGYMPQRDIVTGMGPLSIKQPRIDDRTLKGYSYERFTSNILPRYLRRIPSIDSLIPALYLKGISTNDSPAALTAILGEGASGLSAANIVRLKNCWEKDYLEWKSRDLSHKNYVYFWVDGIYFNVRLEDEKTCILVIIGADKNGNKELVAVADGFRESKLSWREILLDLKQKRPILCPQAYYRRLKGLVSGQLLLKYFQKQKGKDVGCTRLQIF
jgi:putative transposase